MTGSSLVGGASSSYGAGFAEKSVLINIGPSIRTGAKFDGRAAALHIPRIGGQRGHLGLPAQCGH
jgi:hypothetical protein